MKGTLYIQRKSGRQLKKPEPLECEVDMRKDDIAIAGIGSTVKAVLHKAQVEHISANGLRISGVEEHGFGLVHYQEWWFIPIIFCKVDKKESP